MPAGLTLAQSDYYAGTVATGELWLDARRLQEYNISVSEADAAGTLVAALPLISLTEARSGFNQFSAHLTKGKIATAGGGAVAGGIAIGAIAVDITGASGAISEDDMFTAERIFAGIETIVAVKDAVEALRDIRGAEAAVNNAGTHLVIESIQSLDSFTTGILLFFGGEYREVDLAPNCAPTKVGAVAAVGQAPVEVHVEFVPFQPIKFTVNPATQERDRTYSETMSDQSFTFSALIRYRLIERNFDCPEPVDFGSYGRSLYFDGVGDHLRIVHGGS